MIEKENKQDIMGDSMTRGVCDKLEIDDVEPITINIPEITTDKTSPINDAITDYEYIRKQSIKNIATCDGILTHALSTMQCEPSPRYIESCSTLIDTSMKCSKSLIEIHEKLKKLRAINNPDDQNNPDNPVNKFVGSVKEVLDQVKNEMD